MTPRGRCHRGRRAMANAGICTEASGNHCRVHCNMPYTQVVYWGGAVSGVQSDTEVVVSVTQPGGGRKWSQQRGRG